MTDLFSGYRLGELQLSNRIVMAPMTRNRATADGVPTPSMATYYAQRAGAGLIVTEGTQPSAVGQGYPHTPGLHTDEQVEGWRAVADAVHAEGGVIFAQLMHAGRISHPKVIGTTPVAPSAVRPAGEVFTGEGTDPFETPRALESDELPAVVEEFVDAARRAVAAGLDGVELHARQRLPAAAVPRRRLQPAHRRLRRYAGEPRPLRGRGGPGRRRRDRRRPGRHPRLPERRLQRQRRDRGGRDLRRPAGRPQAAGSGLPARHRGHHQTPTGPSARRCARASRAPSSSTPASAARATSVTAERSVETSGGDLFSIGRAFIANPDLVDRLKSSAPLNVPDGDTFYAGGDQGYIDYPTLEQRSA